MTSAHSGDANCGPYKYSIAAQDGTTDISSILAIDINTGVITFKVTSDLAKYADGETYPVRVTISYSNLNYPLFLKKDFNAIVNPCVATSLNPETTLAGTTTTVTVGDTLTALNFDDFTFTPSCLYSYTYVAYLTQFNDNNVAF